MQYVILAAGQGRRMRAGKMRPLPKALARLRGKPLVRHVLDQVKKADGHSRRPIIVIGYKGQQVKKQLGAKYLYAWQRQQLGTADAVKSAQYLIEAPALMVLYGDMPMISAGTIKKMAAAHGRKKPAMTMAIAKANFAEHASFRNFGRIIRRGGKVSAIVEAKDASKAQQQIKEVNVGLYVFDSEWLWPQLAKIKNKNAQHEFYLTDLVRLAAKSKKGIAAVIIPAKQAYGVNTLEELASLAKK